MVNMSLDGRTALITGGSRGIGYGIAQAFAEAGADLALVSRSMEHLTEARDKLSSPGRRIEIYSFDMNDSDRIDSFYDTVLDDIGGIDILVNNAGGTRRGPADTITREDWDFVINVNLTSVFLLCRAFGRERMKSGKPGKIVNIASLMSEAVRENNVPYAASKGGIRQLTKALAIDWARHGINVNAIGPGYIKTEFTQPLWEDPKFDEWVRGRTPLGRWGTPDDLAHVAVFLAAPVSDFMTGQILYVDGGWLSSF